MTKNQKGSIHLIGAAVIVLLLIILVGIFVYKHHSDQKSAASAGSATKSSSSAKASSKSSKTSSNTSTGNSSSASTANYYSIPAWKVRAPSSSKLTLLYVQSSANPKAMLVSSAQLNAGGPSTTCTTDNGGAGYIERLLPTDNIDPGETAQAYVSQNFKPGEGPAYSKVGDYYYIYFSSTNNCSNAALLAETQNDFSLVVKNLSAY